MLTYDRKPCRGQLPCRPRQLHRTDEFVLRWAKTGSPAAAVEHAPVEWRIMGDQKLRRRNQRLKVRPHLAKRWTAPDHLPGEAVYVGEQELPPRRPDQLIVPLDDAPALDEDHTERAGAVSAVVSRLEIDGGEDAHGLPPPAFGPQSTNCTAAYRDGTLSQFALRCHGRTGVINGAEQQRTHSRAQCYRSSPCSGTSAIATPLATDQC